MSPEIELKFAERFWFMRPREDTNQGDCIDDLYAAFGMECGDGWEGLFWELCTEIENLYKEYPHAPRVIPVQIKEKYGAMVVYVHFSDDPIPEQIGELSAHAKPKSKEFDNDFCNKVYDLIDKYESNSEFICESCGAVGCLRTDRGWWQTLCDDCNAKQKAEQEAWLKKYVEKEYAED